MVETAEKWEVKWEVRPVIGELDFLEPPYNTYPRVSEDSRRDTGDCEGFPAPTFEEEP